MHGRLALAALVALLLLVPAATASANDNFGDARYLPFGVADTADNTTATTEPGETLTAMGAQSRCNRSDGTYSQADRTLWWWITGTGRPITVTTEGSDFDTHLGVFEGALDGPALCQDADPTESITFPSRAGQTVRIQVGGCAVNTAVPCALERSGHVRVSAYSPPPANDARSHAAALSGRAPGDNYAAGEDPGENLSCRGRNYGRTVWYRWSAPADGSATFSLAHPNGALAVYRPDGTLAGCETGDGDERVALGVARGEYLVQVGGLGAHNALTSDSRQSSFTLAAAFRGGAVRGRGDTVDRLVTSRARLAVAFFSRWSKIRSLSARNVPAGAKVQVRCSGRSCPFRRTRARTIRRKRPSVSLLTAALRREKILPTTTIEVRVTRAGYIGSVTRFRFNRLRRSPVQEVRCLMPGRTTPQRCSR